MTTRHTATLAITLTLLSGCATTPHPWPRETVCSASLRPDAKLDAQAWLSLILKGYDPATRRATSPAVDCAGEQVRWEAPALVCADPKPALSPLPDGPIGEQDVVVSEVDPGHRLVWIIVSRFASGDALGPVAMVKVDGSTLTVEALGALRANPERAKLRIVQAGGATALLAEGERCADQRAASCERAVRVMILSGNRFQPSRIVNAEGACLGAAWLQLSREDIDRVGPGRERRYRVNATLNATPRGLDLLELVTVHDRETRAAAPERLFRRAEGTLQLRPQGPNLVGTTPSLWARLLSTRD